MERPGRERDLAEEPQRFPAPGTEVSKDFEEAPATVGPQEAPTLDLPSAALPQLLTHTECETICGYCCSLSLHLG